MFGNRKKLAAERQVLAEEFVRVAGNRAAATAHLDRLAATIERQTKDPSAVLDMFHFATTVLVFLDESDNDPFSVQQELIQSFEAGLLARVAERPFKRDWSWDFLLAVVTSVRKELRPELDKRFWEQSIEFVDQRLSDGLKEGMTSVEAEELAAHRDELKALLAKHYPG